MKKNKGAFITFEGPEKSGKSTQAKLLSQSLEKKGFKVMFVREPGSTKLGEKIRRFLLDKRHKDLLPVPEMLLYMAARAQLVEEVIKPALSKGCIVICDRFLDSTMAYQGYGSGLNKELIKKVGLIATNGVVPELTLLLDFWGSKAFLRNTRSPDRIEMRSDKYHRKVKRGYFALARLEPQRIKVIKVRQTIDLTQTHIREVVDQWLLKRS